MEDKARPAVETVVGLLEDLKAIVETVQGDRDHVAADSRLERWKSRAAARIREDIGAHEANQFSKDNVIRTRSHTNPVGNVVRECNRYEAKLTSLREELETHPEAALSQAHHSIEPSDASESRRPRVFIAHGGESMLRDRLELFLWRNGFRPLIVEEMPSLGRNPDAQVDYYLDRCQFAVILAEANNPSVQDEKSYPRLNLIDEIARVRKTLNARFVVLLEDGLELPSNESGAITWKRFDQESVDKALAAVQLELDGHDISGADE